MARELNRILGAPAASAAFMVWVCVAVAGCGSGGDAQSGGSEKQHPTIPSAVASARETADRAIGYRGRSDPTIARVLVRSGLRDGPRFSIAGDDEKAGELSRIMVQILSSAKGVPPQRATGFRMSGVDKTLEYSIVTGCDRRPYVIVYGIVRPSGAEAWLRVGAKTHRLTAVAIPQALATNATLVYAALHALPKGALVVRTGPSEPLVRESVEARLGGICREGRSGVLAVGP